MFESFVDFLNLIAILVAVPGFLLTLYALIETPNRNISFRREDPYKPVYGEYLLWNYSMENYLDSDGEIQLVFTKLSITRRRFRVPAFTAKYEDDALDRWNSSASGDVFVSGNRLYLIGKNDDPSDQHDDPSLLVFEKAGRELLDYSVGFLAGYQEPPLPYCGVFVLERVVDDRKPLTPIEVRNILGAKPYLDYKSYTGNLADVIKAKHASS